MRVSWHVPMPQYYDHVHFDLTSYYEQLAFLETVEPVDQTILRQSHKTEGMPLLELLKKFHQVEEDEYETYAHFDRNIIEKGQTIKNLQNPEVPSAHARNINKKLLFFYQVKTNY